MAIRADARLLLQGSGNPPLVFDHRRTCDPRVSWQGKDNPVQHGPKAITDSFNPERVSSDFEADPFKMSAETLQRYHVEAATAADFPGAL